MLLHTVALTATLLFFSPTPAYPADFAVSASSFDFSYTINSEANNPTLTLVRGRTYTFEVNACTCHPFKILGAPANSLTNNDTFSGTITFNVPPDDVDYTYICSIHHFGGTIVTVPIPPLSAIERWRQTHFGTVENSGDAADLTDFDHDGLTNLVEFAFELNPKSGNSLQLPPWQTQGGNVALTFAQPASVEGIVYAAEWNDSPAAEGWTAIPDTGTAGQHSFSVTAAGHARLFARLKVITKPPQGGGP